MADPVIFETPESRAQKISVTQPTVTTNWTVMNLLDDGDVRTLVFATVPSTYADLLFQDFDIKCRGANGPDVWDVEVHYSRRQPGTPGTMKLEWDQGGETVKITHSLSSTYYPASLEEEDASYSPEDSFIDEGDSEDEFSGGAEDPGGTPQDVIDFKNAIGVREHGGKRQAEGKDETFPTFEFTIKRYFGTASDGTAFPLTTDFMNLLKDKAWHVNSDDIEFTVQGIDFSFDAGELLFKGSTGDIGSDGYSEVSMKFSYSPNLTDQKMGGITYDKDGHEYVWAFLEDEEDGGTDLLIPRVRQVCVEQTKRKGSLSGLFT